MTVLAYTSRGEGVRSEPISCHTEEDGKNSIRVKITELH